MIALALVALVALFALFPVLAVLAADFLAGKVRPTTYLAPRAAAAFKAA